MSPGCSSCTRWSCHDGDTEPELYTGRCGVPGYRRDYPGPVPPPGYTRDTHRTPPCHARHHVQQQEQYTGQSCLSSLGEAWTTLGRVLPYPGSLDHPGQSTLLLGKPGPPWEGRIQGYSDPPTMGVPDYAFAIFRLSLPPDSVQIPELFLIFKNKCVILRYSGRLDAALGPVPARVVRGWNSCLRTGWNPGIGQKSRNHYFRLA